jgi:riboflavin biosynthesis pyrimidine reductase
MTAKSGFFAVPPAGIELGANIDQQFLAAGLVDGIRIHVVNVLLAGSRQRWTADQGT